MTNHLELIQDRFPGALLLKPTQAGSFLNLSKQSSYNRVARRNFPVPLVRDALGRHMVRLVDLAAYLDGLTVIHPAQPAAKSARGRPSKKESIEAQHAGVSVAQLRGQKRGAL